MSDSVTGGRYYWCLRHGRVETFEDKCRAENVLGPYASAQQAEQALETVRRRNEAWQAEDAAWTGEEPD